MSSSSFLRNGRATLIPTVAVPVSLIGTFAVMYLFGFSIDNLSLMALTISTGFVVDDAIVVMENISRLREDGMPPMKAAFEGSREIGFTILSISMSLIAVFIPILFMAGIVGRLFREFAITLSTAILVSMVISLTTTPMMCAYLLKDERTIKHGRAYRVTEKGFAWMVSTYSRSLKWVLKHPVPMLILLLLTIALEFLSHLTSFPKGFFPQQDTGVITGSARGPQDASFPVMDNSILQIEKVIQADPAVAECNCPYRLREHRQYLYRAEAAQCAEDLRRGGYQSLAAQVEPASRRFSLSCRQRRICASADDRRTRSTNTPFSRTTFRICPTGVPFCLPGCRSFADSRM